MRRAFIVMVLSEDGRGRDSIRGLRTTDYFLYMDNYGEGTGFGGGKDKCNPALLWIGRNQLSCFRSLKYLPEFG